MDHSYCWPLADRWARVCSPVSGQDVHERGLPSPGRAHDGHQLSTVELSRNSFQKGLVSCEKQITFICKPGLTGFAPSTAEANTQYTWLQNQGQRQGFSHHGSAVPNLFGTRDWFRGRQFFHGWRGRWFRDDSSAFHLLCTLFLLLLQCNIQRNNYTAHHNAESVGGLSLFSCS